MKKNKIYPVWFLVIPVALYFVFFLLPGLMGLFYSFTDWNVYSHGNIHFAGLENFRTIFSAADSYLKGIWNTLKFTLVSNFIKLLAGLFLAVMLQRGIRGRNLYRTILYLPSVVPYLVIGLIFTSILNYNHGLLNALLEAVGVPSWKQEWLGDTKVVWKSIYAVDAWRGIGYVMTIFLAGLNTIPATYYEAASIDGAGFWSKLRHITLPLLTGAITINLVFGLTYGLKVFDIVYVLTSGGPGHATEVATTYIYQLYSKGNYCLSVALNSVLFLLTALIGLLVVHVLSRKEVQQ